MSEWVREEQDGVVYHTHEELGSIIQTKEGFILCAVKIFKVGPLTSLEQAQELAAKAKDVLVQYEDRLNLELVKPNE